MKHGGNHGHKRGGASGPSGMNIGGPMPVPPGLPSTQGSDALAPGETTSMPAPMPGASSAIPGGDGAGVPMPGGFKRGGSVR